MPAGDFIIQYYPQALPLPQQVPVGQYTAQLGGGMNWLPLQQGLGQPQGGLGVAYQSTAWTQWVNVTGTASNTTTVWNTWATTAGTTYQQIYQDRVHTPEEIAVMERLNREAQERADRLAKEAQEAEERAERLLDRHLTENQRKTWQKAKVIYLETARRRYRIHKGRAGNIRVVDKNDQAIQSWCVHPGEAVPDCDTVLAQILHLQNDEETLERLANKCAASDLDERLTERALLAA